MPAYVIGIDIGTGSTKAVACTSSGKIINTAQSYYSMIAGAPGFAEQDPEIIWAAFITIINKILSGVKHVPDAVSLSSCMHSLMAVDEHNKPLTNLITWADTRSEAEARRIRKSKKAEKIYKATGTPIHSMSPLCKIIWLKKNEPSLFEKAFKFISIKEFIWYKLFGSYQIDYSIASATGLFDIKKLTWYSPSLKMCDLNVSRLSQAVSTDFTRNDLMEESCKLLNLPNNTVFCIGASDGCLANLGSFAIESGTCAVTIGTSGAVRVVNKAPVFNYDSMIFNYILDKKNFVSGGPVNNGGNVVQWLFKTFLNKSDPGKSDYENFFSMIETVPAGCNGLLFLPYINGERAPLWDESASGVFIGIKSYHTTAHFLRAGLEGICYALNNIILIIEKSTGSITQLNVSGGFINADIWMKILADISGKNLSIIQTEDASAIGAALIGMKTTGIIDDYSLIKKKNSTIIKPDINNKILYEKYYRIFRKTYRKLEDTMHQLHFLNSSGF